MIEKLDLETNWENFIKMLLGKLDIPTKEDILALHERLDKLERFFYQKPQKTQVRTKPDARRKTASSIVLDVLENFPKGADFKTVKAATGFDEKKLRNIIFRLEKTKKIKRIQRGIYKTA